MLEESYIYGATKLKDIDHLKELMPDNGKADAMNFCLFSTSGVHGHYGTIEELFVDNEDADDILTDITVLVIRPRLAHMFYGTIKVEPEDIEYLKTLRQSSWDVVREIGAADL